MAFPEIPQNNLHSLPSLSQILATSEKLLLLNQKFVTNEIPAPEVSVRKNQILQGLSYKQFSPEQLALAQTDSGLTADELENTLLNVSAMQQAAHEIFPDSLDTVDIVTTLIPYNHDGHREIFTIIDAPGLENSCGHEEYLSFWELVPQMMNPIQDNGPLTLLD